MKTCIHCSQRKRIDAFPRNAKMADGRLNQCKLCVKEKQAAYYRANCEKRKASALAWKKANRERVRLFSATYRDKYAPRLRRENRERMAIRRSKDPTKSVAQARAWQIAHPKEHRAHQLVAEALRKGELVRQPCEVCSTKRSQAHHDDYDLPLKVRWLCAQHHAQHHRRQRRAA